MAENKAITFPLAQYVLIQTRLYGDALTWQETKLLGLYVTRLLAESAMREAAGPRLLTPAGSHSGVDVYTSDICDQGFYSVFTIANSEVI